VPRCEILQRDHDTTKEVAEPQVDKVTPCARHAGRGWPLAMLSITAARTALVRHDIESKSPSKRRTPDQSR